MLTQTDIELIQDSFSLAYKDKDALTRCFYNRLFAVAPQTKMLFPVDLEKQRNMLVAVMAMIVKGLREPEKLQPFLCMLGENHAKLGVKTEHYRVFTEVFIETLVEAVGQQPDDRLEAAWYHAFDLITPEMKRATDTMGLGLQ